MKKTITLFNSLNGHAFIVVLFVLMLLSSQGWGQTVVTVGGGATVVTPNTPTATWTTPPTGVTFSNWSRGTGVTWGTATNALSGSGFNSASASAGFTANAFYSVTIAADATHSFTLNGLTWITQLSGSTNSCNFTVQYKNNGGALTSFGTTGQSITSSGSQTTFTFSGTVSVSAGTSIVIYLTPHQATAAGTTVRWVNGSTISVTASSTDATLSALTLSSGTLSPTFASSTTTYTASVSNSTASVTVTPTYNQANATIQARVNSGSYSSVTSGSPSSSLALNVGSNTLDVKVTAQDGTTSKTYTITVSRAAAAPSVTTTAVSLIGTTSATFNGDITSDGGDAITGRGFSYNTSSGVIIGNNQTSAGGTATGTYSYVFNSLDVNAQYFYKAYATNNTGTSLSATEISFYTLANVPSAPTVNNASSSTLDVAVNVNANPAATEFAIYETGTGLFVQSNGTLSASVVWQTAATWSSTITVNGLAAFTPYTFEVKARNGAHTETAYGSTASLSTLAGSTPAITVGALTSFGNQCINSTYGPNDFTISAVNLTTDDVSIAALDGYTYSLTPGGSYSTTLTITQGGGSLSQTISVKFTPTAVQSYNGSISVGGGGAATVTTSVTASGVNTSPTVTTAAATAITLTSATISGTITANGCTSISAYGFEYSTNPGFANGAGTPVAGSNLSGGSFSVDLSALNNSTPYYYHSFATNAGGTAYSTQGSFSTLTPSLSVGSLSSFGSQCINATYGPNNFTVTASNLTTADLSIPAVNGFTFATTSGGTYTTSLTISQAGGSYTQTIYVKFSPTAVQSYNGSISVGGGGAVTVTTAVTASGMNTSATVTTTSPAASIAATTVTLSGDVTAEGCQPVTARGICYGTSLNPDISGSKTTETGTSGTFSSNVTGLLPNTNYHFRAYATTSVTTSYGSDVTFATGNLTTPTATAASSLTSSGFTANWNAEAGASSYRLDVSTNLNFFSNLTSIVGWNFPNNPDNATADIGIAANNAKTITINGGVTTLIFNTGGATTNSANAVNWQSGNGAKYWEVDFTTSGYYNIKVSSKQRGSNTAPRDFKLQYKLGSLGTYFDVPGSAITVANNYTSGVLNQISLPSACENQSSVYLRWIMTSDISVNAGTVLTAGSANIDDILIEGNIPEFVSGYNDLSVGSTSTVVITLTPNTNYYYRVRAYSASSTSPNSNVITALTTPAAATASVTLQPSCATSTATVVITAPLGAYEYNIDGGTYTSSTTFTGITAGNHDILVRSATVTSSISVATTVTVNAQPVSPVAVLSSSDADNTICAGSTVSFTASGGNSYEFFVGAVSQGAASSTTTFVTPSLTNLQVVTVKVGNASGCYTTSSGIATTVHVIPTVSSASVSPASVCVSGTVSYTATPSAGSIQWYNAASGGSIVPPPSTITSTTTLYAEASANGCVSVSRSTVTATVYDLPTPVITGATAVCANTTASVYSVLAVAGHTYSWTVTGGSITAGGTTNSITVNWGGAAAATVDVIEGIATVSCTASATQKAVTITALPTASISYIGSPFCTSTSEQIVSFSGTSGGTYTSTSGLSLNETSGSISPITSSAGTYTVTYTIAAAGGCAAVNETAAVSITTLPIATISYIGSPWCTSALAQTVTVTGTTGGTFTSTSGLSLNTSTGEITPASSTAGTYTVTYTIAASGGCSTVTATTGVTITTLPTASISYAGTPYCLTIGTPQSVTLSGSGDYSGGSFSADPGLSLDAVSGSLTPSSSTASTYTVTYTIAAAGGCNAVTATTLVQVTQCYTLSISKSGADGIGGRITSSPAGIDCGSSCSYLFPAGSTIGLTAIPIAGATFAGWSGAATGTSSTASIDMTGNKSVNARFTYSLTVSKTGSGGGQVTSSPTGIFCGANCDANYDAGTSVNLTAAAAAGSVFSGWSGAATGTSTSNAISIESNQTVYAEFSCLTPATPGSISGTATVCSGSSQTYSIDAVPNTLSYTWSLPSGWVGNSSSNSITATTGMSGTISVIANNTCGSGTAQTLSVTVNQLPTAAISYTASPWCSSALAQTVSLTTSASGNFSSSPSGLAIDASNGTITPSATTAGTYTVIYTIAASGACSAVSASTNVTITALPEASISFSESPICTSASVQTVSFTGTTGGTYTSTSGLSLNTSTGEITPASSSAGTYTVTYTIAAAGGCDAVTATTNVTITTLPTATISYIGSPFCTSVSSHSVSFSGTSGGTYTSTSGLSLNTSTGEISPASSTAGTYTVTYTIASAGGCSTVTATTNVTITTLPTATISYSGSPWCTSVGAPSIAFPGTVGGTNAPNYYPGGNKPVTITGTHGGVFTSAPVGLSIDAYGAITPASSAGGTYTVTYTIAASGGCATVTATTNVTITTLPTAAISYIGSPFCSSVSSHSVSFSGTTGGTYTSTSGLSLNTSTGEITPASSNAGTYTVTYTIAAAGGCAAVNATAGLSISSLPTATISYSGSPMCTSASAQTVSITGTTGGTFTSTSGLSLNTSTGEITPTTSTAGTYTVTYTIAAASGCDAVTATTTVTITALPNATISYSGSPMCTSTSLQSVSFAGTTEGVYTSTSGLSLNSSTGAITPSTSTAGTYTVTYTIAASGGCIAVNATADVSITTLPTANISYNGSPMCTSASAQTVSFTGTTGGTYTSTSGLSLNTSTGLITPASSTAGTYTVTYTIASAGGCSAVTAFVSVSIVDLPSQPIVSVIQPSCATPTATVSVTSSLTGLHFSKNAVDYSNTSGVFSGLTAPGAYSITARNDNGCVSQAATGSINNQPITPPAPTANAASAISSTGFTANWSSVNPPNWAAGSGVSYFLDVSTSNSFTSFVTGYNNQTAGTGTALSVSGLTANTTYYYRIRSQYYSLCTSVNSNVITVTTLGPPTLTTTAMSLVLTTSASSGGNITADGGSAVTARGVCWSTSPTPTTASSTLTTDGSGTGSFTSGMTGLLAFTTYYVRAYATNSIGTAYGNQLSFMTASGSGTIVTTLADVGIGSLRDALNNVADGGFVTFADNLNGTINLATSLIITKNFFFDNHNLAIGTILSGSGACITINAGKSITLVTGSKLTVTGAVLNNGGKGIGGLLINSGASFIHNTIDLQATVKRDLNPGWHLFGSPFKQNTGSSLGALIPVSGNVQMIPYTNGANWGTSVSSPYYYFLPTVGYAVKPSAAVTATLTGNLYYSPVDYTIALNYNGTGATQSWNLVANPYTSYINFNLLGKTNLNTSLYLWDNSLYPLYTPVTNAAYFRTYNSCNNVGVPANTTPFIAPLQGFFVRGIYTAPKISFLPSARVHSTSPYYKELSNTEILVRLKTESEQGMDELVICKNPAAKLDFEQFDSEKLFGGMPIEFYSQSSSGEKLVINTINSTETIIPLGINGSAGAKGRITAFALESGEQVYLEDRLKAKIISLTENTTYDFEFPGDQVVGRFFIRFGAINTSLTTSDVKVFVNENQLNVMAQTGEEIQGVEVFTVSGARVFKTEIGKTNVFTTDLQLAPAMYLVRVKTSLATQNVKIRL